MIVSAWERWVGRALLVILMLVTVLPFVSLFVTALHEPGTYPGGISLPALLIATLAGFALGHLRPPGGRAVFIVFLLGLTLPFEGIIVPLYYQMREVGLLNTRWAIIRHSSACSCRSR